MGLSRAQKSSRTAVIFAVVGMFKVAAAALFVGTALSLFALSPSADKADARVFFVIGPAFLLGALVSGFLALRAWRARSDRRT